MVAVHMKGLLKKHACHLAGYSLHNLSGLSQVLCPCSNFDCCCIPVDMTEQLKLELLQ